MEYSRNVYDKGISVHCVRLSADNKTVKNNYASQASARDDQTASIGVSDGRDALPRSFGFRYR